MKIFAKYPPYKFVFAALDVAVIILSLVLAGNVSASLLGRPAPELDAGTWLLYAAYTVVGLLLFQSADLYKINVFTTTVDQGIRLVRGTLLLVLVIALETFFTKLPGGIQSRLLLGFFGVFCVGIGFLMRVLVGRELFGFLTREGLMDRNVLIVGAQKTGMSLAVSAFLSPHLGLRVTGFLDDTLPAGTPVFRGITVAGKVADLAGLVQERGVGEVVICLEDTDHARLMEVIAAAVHTTARVKVASSLYEVVPARLMIERYGDIPVIDITQNEPGRLSMVYKRVFDMTVALLALAALAPLLLLIALAIVADSRGPVIFRQTRIGRRGRPFTFYKFRSMAVGSDLDTSRRDAAMRFVRQRKEETAAGSTKIVNEQRVTRVGRLLRRTSLDELPQLLNVLKGDMSLVGPRPCLPYEWAAYEEWHKRRLSVLPGCTGLWQVHGRSEVGFEDMVVLDLYYIQNASPWMDLQLILKTIPVMLFGTGAK